MVDVDFRYSPTADALYIRFNDRRIAYTDNISRRGYYERGVDYADDDTPVGADDDSPVGVEFLNVSRGVDLTDVPHAEEIARLLREHQIRELA